MAAKEEEGMKLLQQRRADKGYKPWAEEQVEAMEKVPEDKLVPKELLEESLGMCADRAERWSRVKEEKLQAERKLEKMKRLCTECSVDLYTNKTVTRRRNQDTYGKFLVDCSVDEHGSTTLTTVRDFA